MARVVFIDGPVDGRTERATDPDLPRLLKVAAPRWAPALRGGVVCTDMEWGEATYQLACVTVEGTRVYTWTR